jgi:hypothetical protein
MTEVIFTASQDIQNFVYLLGSQLQSKKRSSGRSIATPVMRFLTSPTDALILVSKLSIRDEHAMNSCWYPFNPLEPRKYLRIIRKRAADVTIV